MSIKRYFAKCELIELAANTLNSPSAMLVIMRYALALWAIHFAATAQPLRDFCNDANAIVVADLMDGQTAGQTRQGSLQVVRVLKGSVRPGETLRVSYTTTDRASAAPVAARERALFFLQAPAQGVWPVMLPWTGGLGWRAASLPARQKAEPARTPQRSDLATRVIAELAARVQETPHDTFVIDRFRSVVAVSDSPWVLELARSWAGSANVQLRSTGLGYLISSGSPRALAQVAGEIRSLAASPSDGIAGPLGRFASTDPEAIRSLGRIATSPDAPAAWQTAATESLADLHTRETLPFLALLLDQPDRVIVSRAVAGFSAYVTGMRSERLPGSTGPTWSEVLRARDPGTLASGVDPSTRAFLHFGPFRDDAEARAHARFWRAWYQKTVNPQQASVPGR